MSDWTLPPRESNHVHVSVSFLCGFSMLACSSQTLDVYSSKLSMVINLLILIKKKKNMSLIRPKSGMIQVSYEQRLHIFIQNDVKSWSKFPDNSIRKISRALAGVAQWIEHWLANQRVTSIPSQGTCLGCRPGRLWGVHKRQPHIDVSLPLFLPPSPSL